MTSRSQQNFYSNPAFCQQSEFYNAQRCNQRALSPGRTPTNRRQSPLGAQTPVHVLETSIRNTKNDNAKEHENEYEQEFYEEMLVDDNGYVQQKKILVVSSPNNEAAKIYRNAENNNQQQARTGSRYASIPLEKNHNRYEYIPMTTQEQYPITKQQENNHRYEEIPDIEQPIPKTSGRYALVPLEEVPNQNRYAVITQNGIQKPPTFDFIKEDNQRETQSPHRNKNYQRTSYADQQMYNQQPQRKGNPIATQKLYELLQTPKKSFRPPQLPVTPQQTPRKQQELSPTIVMPHRTTRHIPKAQQKLNYTIGHAQDRKHTAIVAPICSSPAQSVYSETTYSKTESEINLSMKKPPVQGTLAVAALMMFLCGGVTSGLCFYMISIMGRLYFLEFGVVSGFTCLLFGILGFRTRNCYWLPNRNYISGKK